LRLPDLVGFERGLRSILRLFLSDLTLPGLALALAGALRLWKTGKGAVVMYGAIVILILFLVSLNSAFISAYLVPAVLMLTIWVGFGTACLCGWAERASSAFSGLRGKLLARSVHCAAVLLFLALLIIHFPENNKRRYGYAKKYGQSLLSSLPQNAVLITGTAEPLFISWYLQYCENYRTDVKVITRNGLTRPGYLDQIRRQYPQLNIPKEFHYENDEGVRPSHLHTRKDRLPWFANSYFKLFYEMNISSFPIFWEGIESNQLLMDRFVPYHPVFRILPPGEKVPSDVSDVPNAAEIGERIGHDLAAGRIYGNHLFNYGVYYQWHKDFAAAERFYEDSLRLYPNDSRALNNIGAILAQRGEDDEAFEKFLAAFRANPNDAASNHNVGQAFLNRGEARKAVPYFRRAISSDAPKFEDYHNLGLCYADMGRNRLAAEMLREALQLKPDFPEALSSLGVVYLRLKETESARKLLKMAIEIEPDNAQNWYNFACLQTLEGDTHGSSDSLRKALSLDYKAIYDLASRDPRLSPVLDSLLDAK
jgi:Tfp pilus assembly protein PilF